MMNKDKQKVVKSQKWQQFQTSFEGADTTLEERQFQIGTTLIASDEIRSRTNLMVIKWYRVIVSEIRKRVKGKKRTRNDGVIVDYVIAQSSFLLPSDG